MYKVMKQDENLKSALPQDGLDFSLLLPIGKK
jgi:hypothetical protein